MINKFYIWSLKTEGSSRSSALIRIGLVLIIWARWGNELTLFHASSLFDFIFSGLFFISTTLMLIGFYSNLTTFTTSIITLTMYYYFGFTLGHEPWTHHHTYLLAISTFLCSFTPCGKSYSLDRYLEIKKAIKHKFNIPAETGNLFGLRLLSLQLAAVYFWTAFDKSTITWITGQKMEVNFMFQYTGSSYPDFPGFHLMMVILALAVLILEYALSVGLFFKITRKILIIPGIILHCIIYITLPVKTFTATVILLYLSFFDSDEVHKFIDKISGFIESGKNQRL